MKYHHRLRPADVGHSDVVIHAGKVSEIPPHVVDTYDETGQWVGSCYFKSKAKAVRFLKSSRKHN